jgi:hypothetical protein
MDALPALVLTVALCVLFVVGLASVLRDLLRRDIRFTQTSPAQLARKDNRYGIASVAPARNAAAAGSRLVGDRNPNQARSR